MRRTGTVARQIENNCKMIVNVDHHITNDIQGDHNWIRADVSSTGEMMFDIISALGSGDRRVCCGVPLHRHLN